MAQVGFSRDCDVVIVNYNAGGLLVDCVQSVLAEEVGRVIVVDNASIDCSVETLVDANQGNHALIVIRNQINLGFAKACNIGMQASTARYILFLNPDSTLSPGALGHMLAVLNSALRVGMVGGLLCNPDGSEQPGGRRVFPTPKRAFMRAFGLSRFAMFLPEVFSDFLLHKEPLPAKPVAVEAISGACMLVKREAMEDVGKWDEDYFLHCEDLDWCMRFRQKGWHIMFVPDARVMHVWGGCSRSRPIFVEWHKHHGMIRFYRKFFRHQYPGLLMWLVMLGVWLRFAAVVIYYSFRHAMRLLGLKRG